VGFASRTSYSAREDSVGVGFGLRTSSSAREDSVGVGFASRTSYSARDDSFVWDSVCEPVPLLGMTVEGWFSLCGLLASHPFAQNAEGWGTPLLLSGLGVHLECVGHPLLVLVAKGLLALRRGHLVPQDSQVLL